MKIVKLVFVVIIALSFTGCDALKLTSSPPFQIKEATYKSWVGGQPGVSGVRVVISYESIEPIAFDSIYFHNKSEKLQLKTVKGINFATGFFDTSTRIHTLVIEKSEEPKKKKYSEPFPFNLAKNEAVISYVVHDVVKYFKVKNIKKTKTDIYP